MRHLIAAIALCAATYALPAQSQERAFVAVTAAGTPIHFFGLAMAKTADEISDMDLRLVPYKSSGQGAVIVNRGEADFGMHNAIVLREAYAGEAFYEGRPLENLRAVARLVPFQMTLGVRGDSDIRRIADLKGRRFPAGFDATAFGERLYEALLGTEGLSYQDVDRVEVADWAALGKAFIQGDVEANGLIVGTATAARYEQVLGSYRGLSIPDTPEVRQRLQTIFPSARLATVNPADGLAGILEPTVVLEYDYWLFAHAATPDGAVTALLASLWDGKEILAGISPDFRAFDPAAMGEDIGIPFHPAAEAFYAAKAGQ